MFWYYIYASSFSLRLKTLLSERPLVADHQGAEGTGV